MRVPVMLSTNTKSRHNQAKYFQAGGALPHYVQSGTGFFGNLFGGLRRLAMPVLKSIGKAVLPMASQAIETALTTNGSVKQRLKAAGQSALTKKNLTTIGKAALRPII